MPRAPAIKKTLRVICKVGYPKVAMEEQTPNINVIRSVWRRLKKDIKVRDLQPVKDVKGGGGGGGVTGKSNSPTGCTGTTRGLGSH
jgi:hypothetical protein